MTDEDASEARSAGGLITQRMVAERGRLEASGCLILAAVMFAQAALRGVPTDTLAWVFLAAGVILGVGFIGLSVRVLRARSKRIEEFEAKHGVGAGRQEPVTRK